MRKIAVFVEGELIFVRNLLLCSHLIDISKVSFECLRLYSESEQEVPFAFPNEHAKIHFQITNVGNDARVLAEIKRREAKLFKKGFSRIIGLRDMYSKAYRKRATHIDPNVTGAFVNAVKETIAEMDNADKISFHFAIMELEAWWLGMYNLFAKINSKLTVEFVEEHLHYDLSFVDPEKSFFHPAVELDKIYQLIEDKYGKSRDEVESITTKIESSDISDATNHDRCGSFKEFCNDLSDCQ